MAKQPRNSEIAGLKLHLVLVVVRPFVAIYYVVAVLVVKTHYFGTTSYYESNLKRSSAYEAAPSVEDLLLSMRWTACDSNSVTNA